MRRIEGFLVAILLLVTVSVSGAQIPQITKGQIAIGGSLSLWEPEDADNYDLGSSILMAGSFRYFLSDKIAIEGGLGYWRDKGDREIYGTNVGKLALRDIEISGTALIFFKASPQVFAYGGGGFIRHGWKYKYDPNDLARQYGYEKEDKSKGSFGFQFLGGAEYFIQPNLSINGEIRFFTGEVDDWDFAYGGVVFSGGIRYYLTKK